MHATMKSQLCGAPLALAVSLACGLASESFAQQSPLARVAPEEHNYPSGARLRANYEEVGGAASVPVPRAGMTEAVASLGAAAEIQSRMPEGLTLGEGSTVRISGDTPARAAAAPATRFEVAPEAGPGRAPAKYVTLYPIEYQGIPLMKGSDYLAMVAEDGSLLHTRERSLPTNFDATEPTVTPEAAVEAATEAAGVQFAGGDPTASEPELEYYVEERDGRLAWTFTLASESLIEPEARRYWIAATGEPEVLHWESEIFHTHHGTVSGNYWSASPFGPTVNQGLRHLEVRRTGAGDGMRVTAKDGRYGFTMGTGNATIAGNLAGPHVNVDNQAGADMETNASGTHQSTVDLNFGATDEFTTAQVSAFHWTNMAHELAEGILAPTDLPNLITRVNINSSCNAFWNGNSINFFRAGGNCPNTAYADVVLHEFGHGADARKGGILDGGYSEGFGDAMALLATRQPCLGRDFFGAGTCLRPATDVILWPPAPGDGVHAIGRRYAGFTWELIEQLKNTYSDDGAFGIAARLILGAALANPSDIPDAVHLSFLVDDDDGSLANGTPHFEELANAADSRNIPRPPDPIVLEGVVARGAHFPWSPRKQISTNSNILEASLSLTEATDVHITANTSARTAQSGVLIRTGFYSDASPNVMWTNSFREVTLQQPNQWVNFGSAMAIRLPAGNHTIYWKLWTGNQIEFSSGTLLVEGLGAGGPLLAVASAATIEADEVGADEEAAAIEPPEVVTQVDESGTAVTLLQP
jgi:hypothetical protein